MHVLTRSFPWQVLHTGRMRSREARHPRAEQLLDRLRANHLLYISPVGSNDDWYWIYAAAQAGASRPFAGVLAWEAQFGGCRGVVLREEQLVGACCAGCTACSQRAVL